MVAQLCGVVTSKLMTTLRLTISTSVYAWWRHWAPPVGLSLRSNHLRVTVNRTRAARHRRFYIGRLALVPRASNGE